MGVETRLTIIEVHTDVRPAAFSHQPVVITVEEWREALAVARAETRDAARLVLERLAADVSLECQTHKACSPLEGTPLGIAQAEQVIGFHRGLHWVLAQIARLQ